MTPGIGGEHSDLTVVDLSRDAGVLPAHPRRRVVWWRFEGRVGFRLLGREWSMRPARQETRISAGFG